MGQVGHRLDRAAQGLAGPLGDDRPVEPRPGDRVIVGGEVAPPLLRAWRERSGLRPDQSVEDGGAQRPRAGMDEEVNPIGVDARLAAGGFVPHLVDGLHLAEVVAGADAAQTEVVGRRDEAGSLDPLGPAAVPRLVEGLETLGGPVGPQLLQLEVSAEQTHAAADIRPDQGRVEIGREQPHADRAVLARMQVRHRGERDEVRDGSCEKVELSEGVTLDPGASGEEAMNRCCRQIVRAFMWEVSAWPRTRGAGARRLGRSSAGMPGPCSASFESVLRKSATAGVARGVR